MTPETNLRRFLRTWRDIPPATNAQPETWAPRVSPNADRNAAIEQLYRGGKTLREIAAIYPEISFQRVHQILYARDVPMRAGGKRRIA
jgi:hypothetical protein